MSGSGNELVILSIPSRAVILFPAGHSSVVIGRGTHGIAKDQTLISRKHITITKRAGGFDALWVCQSAEIVCCCFCFFRSRLFRVSDLVM